MVYPKKCRNKGGFVEIKTLTNDFMCCYNLKFI